MQRRSRLRRHKRTRSNLHNSEELTMFTLTRDQQSMVDAVRDFAANELAPHAAEWDETGHFPIDVLREAGGMGLGAICIDERFGGSGLGRSDAVRLFEQLAEGDTTIAAYISIPNMVVGMIDRHGDDRQRAEWIPTLAT
ncbi:MAG: acyl-CoA dehydrogenase family protein, partial [Pseudolysinimonas sp.]